MKYCVTHQVRGTLVDCDEQPIWLQTVASAKTVAKLDHELNLKWGLESNIKDYSIVSSTGFSQPAGYTPEQAQRVTRMAFPGLR